MLRATSVFRGCSIQAKDGKAVYVNDVLFDGSSWKIRWLVVDTGSWGSGRLVLIHPPVVDEADLCIDKLYVDSPKDEIANGPGIFQDPPVSRQMESHFGAESWQVQGLATDWAGYPFMAPPLVGETATGDRSVLYARSENLDPNLRSAREISGYHVHAVDGGIGHLQEFLIDDATWMIRHLIIDTRNWWPGPHVMLAPLAVVEIDFWRRVLLLNVTRDQVRNSPEAWEHEAKNSVD